MKYVYLVTGEVGDWADYMTWVVKAFTTKELAEDYCKQLNQAKHIRTKKERMSVAYRLDEKYLESNNYDVEEVEYISIPLVTK